MVNQCNIEVRTGGDAFRCSRMIAACGKLSNNLHAEAVSRSRCSCGGMFKLKL